MSSTQFSQEGLLREEVKGTGDNTTKDATEDNSNSKWVYFLNNKIAVMYFLRVQSCNEGVSDGIKGKIKHLLKTEKKVRHRVKHFIYIILHLSTFLCSRYHHSFINEKTKAHRY